MVIDGQAMKSLEGINISRISNNLTKTLLQYKTVLYFMRRILNYSIDFESHYGVPLVQARSNEVVEEMINTDFLPNLRIYSYR